MTNSSVILNEQERAALERGEAVRILDGTSGAEYVVLRADVYDRVCVQADGFDPEQTYAAAHEVWRDAWDDPKMAEYDRYDDYKK
jgi:hypothetical protein